MGIRRNIIVRCGIGAACLVGATALHWTMLGILGYDLPYVAFYPLVFLAAITGGWISVAFVTFPALVISFISQHPNGIHRQDIFLGALFAATSVVAACLGEIYLRKTATLHDMIEYLNKESQRRVVAEDVLAEQMKLYESGPELAHFGVFRLDFVRDICYWPPSSSVLLGKEAEATVMSIKEALALVVDEDRERVTADLNALVRDGQTRKTEYVVTRLDGKRRYMKSVAKLVHNKEGHPIVVGTMLDITDERSLHFQLHQREEEYRQLVENQIGGIGLVDADEQILYMNPAGRAIYELADYHGHKITEFVSQHEVARIAAETMKRATGASSTYELEIVTAFGNHRTLLVSGAPRFDADGHFVATFGVFHDITERKKAERDMRDVEDRFRQIVHSTPEVFWIADEVTSAIIYASPAFEAVFGVPLSAVKEDVRRLLDIVYEEDRARVVQSLSGNQAKSNNSVEFRIHLPNGQSSEIRMQNWKMRDEATSLNRIAGIAADITSVKKSKIHLA